MLVFIWRDLHFFVRFIIECYMISDVIFNSMLNYFLILHCIIVYKIPGIVYWSIPLTMIHRLIISNSSVSGCGFHIFVYFLFYLQVSLVQIKKVFLPIYMFFSSFHWLSLLIQCCIKGMRAGIPYFFPILGEKHSIFQN